MGKTEQEATSNRQRMELVFRPRCSVLLDHWSGRHSSRRWARQGEGHVHGSPLSHHRKETWLLACLFTFNIKIPRVHSRQLSFPCSHLHFLSILSFFLRSVHAFFIPLSSYYSLSRFSLLNTCLSLILLRFFSRSLPLSFCLCFITILFFWMPSSVFRLLLPFFAFCSVYLCFFFVLSAFLYAWLFFLFSSLHSSFISYFLIVYLLVYLSL